MALLRLIFVRRFRASVTVVSFGFVNEVMLALVVTMIKL